MSSKSLPAITLPYEGVVQRQHSPTPGSYGAYRRCLRWEFGFTCAACLLHEADVVELSTGAKGTGLFTIEHYVAQKPDGAALVDEYSNLLYLCRWCNTSRGNKPHRAEGVRLLSITEDRWSEVFRIDAEKLVVLDEQDKNAAYTVDCYGLDDERKRQFKLQRRIRLEQAQSIFERVPKLLGALRSADDDSTPVGKSRRTELIDSQIELLAMAQATIDRYRPVPVTDTSCRCADAPVFDLPPVLRQQVSDRGLSLPAGLDLPS